MARLLTAAVLLAAVQAQPARAEEQPACLEPPSQHRITGYVRGEHSPFTASGESVWSRDWLIAANLGRYPLGSVLWVEGLGYYRVADTGLLGWSDIDVLVDTRADAYQLTGWRMACRVA